MNINISNLRDLRNDIEIIPCQSLEPHPISVYGMTNCSDRAPFYPYGWCARCRSLHKLQSLIEA
jgi:hypothetical protein